MLRKIPGMEKKVAAKVPHGYPNKLKDAATGVGVVSGGIGGVGGYNFAAYTNAESRKKKAVVKRDVQWEVSKVSNPLKAVTGFKQGLKGAGTLKSIKSPAYRAGNAAGHATQRVGMSTKKLGQGAVNSIKAHPVVSAVAGGGAAGGGMAYLTNQNKPKFAKNYQSPFEEGTYGEFGKALAAPPGPAGPKKPAAPGGPAGMRALRPAGSLKPVGQKPTSANVKSMRAVPLGQNTAGLSTPGR